MINSPAPKNCACGRSYSEPDWRRLRLVGYQADNHATLEFRNCECDRPWPSTREATRHRFRHRCRCRSPEWRCRRRRRSAPTCSVAVRRRPPTPRPRKRLRGRNSLPRTRTRAAATGIAAGRDAPVEETQSLDATRSNRTVLSAQVTVGGVALGVDAGPAAAQARRSAVGRAAHPVRGAARHRPGIGAAAIGGRAAVVATVRRAGVGPGVPGFVRAAAADVVGPAAAIAAETLGSRSQCASPTGRSRSATAGHAEVAARTDRRCGAAAVAAGGNGGAHEAAVLDAGGALRTALPAAIAVVRVRPGIDAATAAADAFGPPVERAARLIVRAAVGEDARPIRRSIRCTPTIPLGRASRAAAEAEQREHRQPCTRASHAAAR